MSQTAQKFTGTDLATLAQRVALPPPAVTAAQGATNVLDLIEKLESSGFLLEASRVIAHALPHREAVWWACMCAAHTAPPDLPAPDRAARETAEAWVRQQSDKVRRAAMQHAETAAFGTPEAWTAVAAFWSGDSMSPEGQPVVAPAPHLAGGAVAGAVALASVRGDPSRQPARLKRFLESGRNIAAGGPGRLPAEEA